MASGERLARRLDAPWPEKSVGPKKGRPPGERVGGRQRYL